MARKYYDKTRVAPTVQQLRPTTGRRTRYPKHSWHINFRPFQIQPCAIAPVQAGDSVKHLRFEARVLTDPIVDQVAGWWSELYFFYVRLSDLHEYDAAQALAITAVDNGSGSPASYTGLVTAAQTPNWTYHNGQGPDWLFMCMKQIVETHFRPENGAWNDYLLDTVPGAGVVGQTWLDTLSLGTDLTAIDSNYSTSGTDAEGLYEARFAYYERLRKAKLVTVDYPEYLRMQGIDVPQQLDEPLQEKRRPELLRFSRQFAYPSNTVKEDGSGTVAAASWVTSDRMDRPIFCDEPGFIVGCSLVRPKMFRSGQAACGVSMLRDARTFLPSDFDNAPQESLVSYNDTDTTTAKGPINVTDASVAGYWADINGLYVLGDQFVRGDAPSAVLPTLVSIQHSYPPDADVTALFVDDEVNEVQSDGMLSMSITGRRVLSTSAQAVTD